MYGQMYSAVIQEATLAAATDLMDITAPADAVVVLHSLVVTTQSDAADAMVIQILTGSTTGAGTPVTTQPLQAGFAAAGSVVDDTTDATDGTGGNVVVTRASDVRAGIFWHPTPEERIVISAGDNCRIRSNLTITSVAADIELIFEEIGG